VLSSTTANRTLASLIICRLPPDWVALYHLSFRFA
jgi:hypothetical protein